MVEQVNSRPETRPRKSGCGCGGRRRRQVVSGQKETSVADAAVVVDTVVEVDRANGTVRADEAKVADAVVVAEVVNGMVVADAVIVADVAKVADASGEAAVATETDTVSLSKGTASSSSDRRLPGKDHVQTQKVSNQTAAASLLARARAVTKPFFNQAELRQDAMRKQKKRS